jgi:hypothetical protein
MGENFRSTQTFSDELVVATELYDYQSDPYETVNLIDDYNYRAIIGDLKQQMLGFLASQAKKN